MKLSEQLLSLQKSRFTGKLEIKYAQKNPWIIYFCLGRLIWADGGEHPNRFWLDKINKYKIGRELELKNINLARKFECWKYRLLTMLLEEKKIDKTQFSELITKQNLDIFFDIIQAEASHELEYNLQETCGEFLLDCGLTMSSTILNIQRKILKSEQQWQKWCDNKGLKEISPNLAPKIAKSEQLQQKVSPAIYENFAKIIDGKKTLRDLATQLDRDLIKLTLSLLPYINEGLIKLEKIPDLPALKLTSKSIFAIKTNANKPLIACIDDSSQIIFLMEKIIGDAGYNFLGVKNPLQAIPKLISANPDLIFLDIAMPNINGYELCGQIRKIAQFKNTPIIMLTSQDSIVDKVRAKVVGASQFISKPINIETIKATLKTSLSIAKITGKKSRSEKQINPALAVR